MPHNIRTLSSTEYPVSKELQALIGALPAFTAARKNFPFTDIIIPSTITSNAIKLVNAIALTQEELRQDIKEIVRNPYIRFPNYTNTSLDIIYSVIIAATLSITTLTGNTDTIDIDVVDRFHDFIYGKASIQTFTSPGTATLILDRQIGIDILTDNLLVEWVSFNDIYLSSSQYTISNILTGGKYRGRIVITDGSIPLDQEFKVHYTTYDIAFKQEVFGASSLQLVFRKSYTDIKINSISYKPVRHHIFNEYDEIGLLLSEPRVSGETNEQYQKRLSDAYLFNRNATEAGLRHALANSLFLIHHTEWPNTQDSITINHPYEHPIYINFTPIEVFKYLTVQDISSGGVLNPDNSITWIVPLVPASHTPVELNFNIEYSGETPLHTSYIPISMNKMINIAYITPVDVPIRILPTQNIFRTNNNYIQGTLRVFVDGIEVNTVELGYNTFELNNDLDEDQIISCTYISANDRLMVDLDERHCNIALLTKPIISTRADIYVNTTYPQLDLEHKLAFNPNELRLDHIAKTTISLLNLGRVDATNVAVTVHLWDPIEVTTTSTSANECSITPTCPTSITLTDNLQLRDREIRYISCEDITVHDFSDQDYYKSTLLNADGTTTRELRGFAHELTQASPLIWGQVIWDKSYWGSLKERVQTLGFTPNAIDPDLSSFPIDNLLIPLLFTATVEDIVVLPESIGDFLISPDGSFWEVVVDNDGALGLELADTSVVIPPSPPVGPINIFKYLDIGRKRDFHSGVGDFDDLLVSVDDLLKKRHLDEFPTDIVKDIAYHVDYTDYLAKWWVMLNRGWYYINDQKSYMFAEPNTLTFENIDSFTISTKDLQDNFPVLVSLVDIDTSGNTIKTPLRQVNFCDENYNPTLWFTEEICGNGRDNQLYLSFTDIEALTLDGVNTSAIDNIITLDSYECIPTSACFTANYRLRDSYIVNYESGLVNLSQSYSRIEVTHETSDGLHNTNLALNPLFNPHTNGFVYLTDEDAIPTKLTCRVSPNSFRTNVRQVAVGTVELLDVNGTPIPNAVVNFRRTRSRVLETIVGLPTPVTSPSPIKVVSDNLLSDPTNKKLKLFHPYELGTDTLFVWVNGQLQIINRDYTELDINTIEFTNLLNAGDWIYTRIRLDDVKREKHTVVGGQTEIFLSNTFELDTWKLMVYVNGQLQRLNADYVEVDNTTVMFNYELNEDDTIETHIVSDTIYDSTYIYAANQQIVNVTPFVPGKGLLMVYVNGQLQRLNKDYIEANTSSIKFNYKLNISDWVFVRQYVPAVDSPEVGNPIDPDRQLITIDEVNDTATDEYGRAYWYMDIYENTYGIMPIEVNE